MSKFVLDADLRKRIPAVTETLSLEDDQGKVIGVLISTEAYNQLLDEKRALYAYLNANCPYTEEELEKFRNEPGGYTLQELMSKLESQ